MIIEHVYLNIKPEQSAAFETAFKHAKEVIYPMEGLNAVQLIKKVDDPHRYILMIFWDSIEDHQIGFRQSKAYPVWKSLLHHFYDPMPEVEYFEPCMLLAKKPRPD
ncbi:antibiotic biosynthesis monooxygenase family protein [Acinetobacter shaoyimingii]|uniref:Antibiotic biosynthesis monooxygenase n=1 Tax=Acinetobacter shaoyimingii TaxID=2715164 RepID=A0A6G8RRY0_9GAMM|nr:antibiotic biosynthesis monooxygenase [Acinetobacter shaoyimingii]NHB56804.1 antibiotic biosynthesis monooxygenase [Acinetobacter shaoyimingii]QIO04692.1 antibiotic biosynthesis monooxygenase [Acinetobacter shaoyimingii]